MATKQIHNRSEIPKLIAAIKGGKKFVMVAHEFPDGDSLGSALAMACALRKLKKDVRVMTDMVPEKYGYLPGVKEASAVGPKDMSERIAMLFDTPTLERLGSLRPLIEKCRMIIVVDHHVSNSRYGKLNWVDTRAASVGEQVYDLLKLLKVKMDKDIAACLYTSLVTDTGKFQYANTRPRTHRIAAELLATGIAHQKIVECIYEDYPREKLNLLAEALKSLTLECGGKVACIVLTGELLRRAGTTLEWADDIINYARGIRGVEVAVVFKESEEPGSYKVSFRSRNPDRVDVNKVAGKFSGGGHRAASGCTVRGALNDVVAKVMSEVGRCYEAQ